MPQNETDSSEFDSDPEQASNLTGPGFLQRLLNKSERKSSTVHINEKSKELKKKPQRKRRKPTKAEVLFVNTLYKFNSLYALELFIHRIY